MARRKHAAGAHRSDDDPNGEAMITIERDDDNGYFMLVDDGIGLTKSKSRNVLVRIRDALNAVRETSLVGLTVHNNTKNPVGDSLVGNTLKTHGVVLALGSSGDLIVRLADGKLDEWAVQDCRVVEPERPTQNTPWNDPAIGILTAVELLKRWMHVHADHGDGIAIAEDTRTFLAARKAAEPT
jgi:hypothetical protein